MADIHASPATNQPFVRGPFYTNGRFELRFASMLDLVRIAYGVDPEKVLGGPSWLEFDRFDVFAMAPAGSTNESRKQMLKELLADRFKLETHTDSKPIAAWALKAPKKPLLKEPDGKSAAGCNFTVENNGPQPDPANRPLPVIVYTCHQTTMETFAAGMPDMPAAGQYLNNRLVADQTGIQGAFDFTIRFTPKVPSGFNVTGESIPLPDALEKQLGLKMEQASVSMPVVVVDKVNQKPTENSPEALKSFPPPPTEFDVAEIRPAKPASPGANQRAEVKNGRIYIPGITLKNLISIAYNIQGNADELFIGAPKWLDSERFDLIAKTPAGVAIGDLTPSRAGISVNIDALQPMFRSLLIERFKLAAHMEDRPVPTYTLVANKPKLKKAEAGSRTKWSEGAAPDSKDSKNANPTLGRLVTCQNLTMKQFSELLPSIAPGYLHTIVTDATGLEGGFDFVFSFSPAGVLQQGGGSGGGDSAVSEASVPSGALSLFDALNRQLGLKLEMVKRPMPALVIEHVEQKPTDN
ncbi:MAG: TIGR03435 family protein [Candidatus Solibacter sp.]